MSECTCPAVEAIRFWCEQNGLHMVGRMHHLCRTREDYRQQFRSGTSPHHVREAKLQGKPPPPPPQSDYPTLDMLPCVHRGELLGVRPCNLCGGNKGIPTEIFACGIHVEGCSLGRRFKKKPGAPVSCAACRERPGAAD